MENLKVKDLFNESNPKVAAERHEEYLGELSKSLSSPRSFVNGEDLLAELDGGVKVQKPKNKGGRPPKVVVSTEPIQE